MFIPARSMWNPNTWVPNPHEFRLYLDDNAEQFCVVDEVDYHCFVPWRWHINKPHASRNGKKNYVCRNPGRGGCYKPKLYLHVEIMLRTGIEPPTALHHIVDHRDGNELNCRRSNLRWATPRQNRMNIMGGSPIDLLELML